MLAIVAVAAAVSVAAAVYCLGFWYMADAMPRPSRSPRL